MFTISKKVLGLLLLVCLSAAQLACVTVKPADNQPKVEVKDSQPKTEVNVNKAPANPPKTEVNVNN